MELERPTTSENSRTEKLLLAAIIAIVLIISNFPYWYASTHTPVDKEFTGLIGPYGNDSAFYLLWGPKQAADGEWLFEDKCNGHIDRRVVFQPSWLAQGTISKMTGTGVVPVYHMMRVVCALAFYLLLWRFIGRYIRNPLYRFIALLYGIIGSGFGSFQDNPFSPDIWIIESNIFLTMLWEVNLPLANVLLLLAIQAILDRTHIRVIIPALLLTAIYPYAVGNLLALATAMSVLAYFALPRGTLMKVSDTPSLETTELVTDTVRETITPANTFVGSIKTLAAVIAAVAPMTAYNAYLVLSRPDLVTGQDLYGSPALPLYALAFGIATPFAIMGAVTAYRHRASTAFPLFPLVVWVIVNLCIIYFPVPFRLQLILGTSIPIAILAAVGLHQFIAYIQHVFSNWPAWKRGIEMAIVSGFIVLTLPTTVYHYHMLLNKISEQQLPEFVDVSLVKSSRWLAANTSSDEVVFSSAEISYLIPLYGHNRMFTCDYAAPTADWSKRRAEVLRIAHLPEDTAFAAWNMFFREYRIKYLVSDETLGKEIGKESIHYFTQMSTLQEVFRLDDTVVYRVES